MINIHDQHIHSRFSEDSKASLKKYIKRAHSEGMEYFITCEHFEMFHVTSSKPWLFDPVKLKRREEKICRKYNMTALVGIEIGCNNTHVLEMNDIVNSYDFDLVQLSMHDDGVHDYYLTSAFVEEDSAGKYFDYMLEGVTLFKNYDVLSHFDYGWKSALRAHPELKIQDYEDKLLKVFKVLVEDDKTLEINTKVQTTLNNDDYLRYILRLYKSVGGKHLSISSDAHAVYNYRLRFEKYINIFYEEGFTELDYFIKRKRYTYKINH